MRRVLASAVAAASVAGTALWAGAGAAGAVPDVVDRPYKDAKRMIERSGGNPVVATRTGASSAEGNCLVTNAWDAAVRRPNSRGRPYANRDVMVALNCNGALAAPGSPGNSAATEVGRAAKKAAERRAARAARQAAQQEKRELAQAATPGA